MKRFFSGFRSWALIAGLLSSAVLDAQTFSSGSTGADGALSFTTPGTYEFSPLAFNPRLDADGDGVYNFTTINIAAGVTINFTNDNLDYRPVVWLASDQVAIAGSLNLNGEAGRYYTMAASSARPPQPGPGGFSGGLGSSTISGATCGLGPGAARITATLPSIQISGGSAGHYTTGTNGAQSTGGSSYGNIFGVPLLGGSGGCGGGYTVTNSNSGGGGGAGGGAILIASSTSVTVSGSILANGGAGGSGSGLATNGGGGSGGLIRIAAPAIYGNGTISVAGGTAASTQPGSRGRVRLEAFNQAFTGTTDPFTRYAKPGVTLFPTDGPGVRVVSIAGAPAPTNPTSGFFPPDITLNEGGPVTVELAGRKIPLGTVVTLVNVTDTGDRTTAAATPLAGTFESSTASAVITVPPGYSRFYIEASW